MKRVLIPLCVVILAGSVAFADVPTKAQRIVDGPDTSQPPVNEALETINYWNESSAFYYTWNGLFYMSNLFKPDAGWYPLDVVGLEVLAVGLDGNTATGASGVLDGVAVFDPAGTLLARELAVNALVGVWTYVPITSPPRITTGNFFGGLWNSTSIDLGYQCTAVNWTPPPTEPYNCIDYTGATAGGNGAWAPSNCGDQYATVSAASVRATVDSNVPVELMRFEID